MARKRQRAATVLVTAVALGTAFACNVFVTIEQCTSDADCGGEGATCDPVGGFCVRPAPAEAQVEAATDATDGEAALDTGPPRCDPTAPFATMKPVPGFEDTPIITARLTSSETTIYFSKLNGCGLEACFDLFVAQRPDARAKFNSGGVLPTVNCTQASEYFPSFSGDRKLLMFESSRLRVPDPDGGGCGNEGARIWSAKLDDVTGEFSEPKVAVQFDTPGLSDTAPYLHPNGRSLYFVSTGREGPGFQDIWYAQLTEERLVTNLALVKNVSSPEAENAPTISLDERTLYFARDPTGGGERRIYVAHRSSPTEDFGTPKPVDEVNTQIDQLPAWLSDDNCRLYFTSDRGGPDATPNTLENYRLWVAERAPPPR